MGDQQPSGTRRLLVRHLGGIATGPDYVTWAVNALDEDIDSPSLRYLAGCDLADTPMAFELAPIFQSTLRELNIPVPEKAELLSSYVAEVATAILSSKITPDAGATRLEDEVLSPFHHPHQYQAWCLLAEGLSPRGDHRQLEGEELDEAIRSEAPLYVRDA